jgi:MFS family permease
MSGDKTWLFYVALAGLAWGTYVPIIFYGGSELSPKPGTINGRLMAILCVGVAYFVLAVLIPLGLFLSGQYEWPAFSMSGLTFSSLAGVAGAVGAICVIFATKAAIEAAKDANLPPGTYKLFIAPLIFGLAPVINTLVSLIWHPKPGEPFHFGFEIMPNWKLLVGIVFVGIGVALVLLSKEEAEADAAKKKQQTKAKTELVAPPVAPTAPS